MGDNVDLSGRWPPPLDTPIDKVGPFRFPLQDHPGLTARSGSFIEVARCSWRDLASVDVHVAHKAVKAERHRVAQLHLPA